MAEEVAIQFLLEKLIAVAAAEIGLVRGFKNELKTLQESLKMVQGVLGDASKRCIQDDDQAVKQWLQNLEDVSFEADNLLDEVGYEILRRMSHRRKVCFSYSSSSVAFRSKMAHKMKDVNEKLKSINERASIYGLQQRVADSAMSLPLAMETNSIAVDPVFIGRDDDASAIIDDMIDSSDGLVVSVVPIVGMGGLGKTTLARNIFNHQSIQKHFSERIWVSVSKKIDKKDLLMKILGVHDPSLAEQTILEQLRSKLKDARYLLVLDDYLNDKGHEWDDFMSCMMGISPKKGNFIIVTTRNQDVASNVTTQTVPSLDMLSDDDCWSIIKARTFPSQPVPDDFETIGKKIACICRGLPLAANVVGGSLRGKGMVDWISFLNDSELSMSKPYTDFVIQVLKISFDRLPSSLLKKCFSYCSIFSKGEELERERLIQLWMAEGLLFGNSDGSADQMEILGDKFYNILLQNFFLQEPTMDKYGRIKHSKMHDFVHDLSCLIEKEKSRNAEDVSCRVRYLPVHYYEHDIEKEQTICLQAFFGNKFNEPKFLYSMFRDCKYLRVLDLQGTMIVELTSSIGKLIHLRFLDLSATEIIDLPDSICKLFHLQTLRLIGCENLKKLPDQLKLLVELRHFTFSGFIESCPRMPPKIGNLTSLQTLSYFIVSNEKGCRIDELGCLKNLQGKLRILNLEMVGGKDESRRACLSEKQNIENLKFVWSKSSKEGSNNDQEVLEGLQPHLNLKGLTIKNFSGDHFPSWTMKMTVEPGITLHKLIKIVLIDCKDCQEIPTLGHLPLLKILLVDGLSSVRSIGASFYIPHQCREDESSRYGVPFPSLERLTLRNMDSLSDWVEAPNTGTTAFPRLEYLEIDDCGSMITAPCHDFPSLKRLCIDSGCDKLQLGNLCKKVSSLTELRIFHNSDVTSDLVEMLLQNNQHLQKLEITDCDNLTQIRLPDTTLKSLFRLEISLCDNLASIENLKGLSMELQGETVEYSLEELDISFCPKLRSAPSGMDSFNKLRELIIGPFSEETGLSLLNESLEGLHQLRVLSLVGYGNWESLPDQLQHLTALDSLSIARFGIEALPEWFSKLSSLEALFVDFCEKLRDVTCLRHLTGLKWLYISRCRMFNEKSSRAEISHIPYVSLD